MTTRPHLRWFAIPFAASLLLASCGDDDTETDTGGTTTDGDTTETTTADTPDTTAAPATDGGSGDPYGGDPYGGGAAPDPTTTVAVGEAGAGASALAVGDGGDLGEILVDAEGMTLYVYANDTEGTSNCSDACATAWPPYVSDADTAGDGITGTVSLIERADGDMQVAVNGQPLYRFAGDAEPGQANGQGTLDVWHVVDPAGTPVEG
jgi:predicted lipoprotein with Yx(FWY)xxD motif